MGAEMFFPFVSAGIQHLYANSAAERSKQAGEQAIGALNTGAQGLNTSYGKAQGNLQDQYNLYGTRGGEIGGLYDQQRQIGSEALSRLQQGILGGPQGAQAMLSQDPGYAFRQQQGEQGIQRAAAAAGTLGSGGNFQDFARFNQDLASQEYGNALNRLSGLAGIGINATNSLAGVQQNILGAQGNSLGQQAGYNAQLGQAQYGNATNLANLYLGNAAAQNGFDATKAGAWSNALAQHGQMVGNDRNKAIDFFSSYLGGNTGGRGGGGGIGGMFGGGGG